jgi:type 1 glutamine amidotransferase
MIALMLALALQEKTIALIAGPLDSHPIDTHEYEKNVLLLRHLLERSLKNVRVDVHLGGWPADPGALDRADTIVMTSGGSDRKLEDHPLYVGDRLAQLERHMKRGCGVLFYHWSTFHPVAHHDKISEWCGGHFDYETGPPPRKWRSAIETREWTTSLPTPDHPVARGVKPFKVKEEFYFKIRFRDEDPRLKLLLACRDGDPRENAVMWAVERADGGRGLGFTGGHFFADWWNPDFRRLVLNAIAWSAKIEVPAGGVDSDLPPLKKVLVVTGRHHPAHDWRATTLALIQVLERDPRLKVEVVEDPEKIGPCDVLLLNYNNWKTPGLSEAAKAKWLAHEGALAVIHFANGAFLDWPEYREKFTRRAWVEPGSGHDPFGPFRVELKPHEITAGLAPFDTTDELYFKQAGDVPIEPLALARSTVTKQDEPMAWTFEFEKHRAFQTVLGHADVSIREAGALIRRGVAWSAGLPPLGFDPPIDGKAPLRPGAPWKPSKEKGLLPADPGLDGGKGGHWGATGEKDWADARWNAMDVGPFMMSSVDLPGGQVMKGLTVRLEGGAALFDTERCAWRAWWTGGFLKFSPARFGVIDMPKPGSEPTLLPPTSPGRWIGHRVIGSRVLLVYERDGQRIEESPAIVDGQFTRGKAEGVDAPRWPAIVLKGLVSKEKGPYVVDTIPLPFENPWKALMFPGGHDFFANGDAALCTVHGDVWRISGLDATLQNIAWERVATGLYQPLGLRIVDDVVYVQGRDQITRLSGPGVYDCFNNQRPTMGGHNFVACLETDAEGNFYGVGPTTLHRVSKDGRRFEIVAGGFRNPNGMSIGPDGTITVAPQEGEWTPGSMICVAKPGGHHGFGGPKEGVEPPLCYLPRLMDNSSGGQAWVTSERWGPLKGALLNFSFGRSSMQLVLRDGAQGAVVPFPLQFASGAMRGRFHPKDGQLYVSGMKGWVTNAVRDGCFQRVRYTGAPVAMPVAWRATPGALRITFAAPLDRESTLDPERWSLDQWNYRYSAKYGSEDYSAARPDQAGHDPVELKGVRLSEDGREVTLEIPALAPVHQFRARYTLRGADGAPVKNELVATIHALTK